MSPRVLLHCVVISLSALAPSLIAAGDSDARWTPVAATMRENVERQVISGAVTLIAGKDKILALDAVGKADIDHDLPMKPDNIFAIASMTKLVTATAFMMLVDEGKVSVDDPVGKYIPELAHLKTADGVEHAVTIKQMLTHTSGMGEISADEGKDALHLADLIPLYAKKPLQFEPGARWLYCQSGINSCGRIIELVSGESYPDFVQKHLTGPLRMKDTTFYPTREQISRIAKSYKRKNGKLEEAPTPRITGHNPAARDYIALPNAGLFSTASDFGRLCQMVLNKGELDGKRYLSAAAVDMMIGNQIGPMESKHIPGSGFGLGWCVIRDPQGQTAAFSPGSCGHGGAYGTWAWIDPNRGLIYVLMVQRADFGGKTDNIRDAFGQAIGMSLSAALPATNPAGSDVRIADLYNVHHLIPTLYCGSVPDTDAQFKALAGLGVKTVISVDGTKPRVDLAEKYGLRYVHLPFGYDGIPRERELEIARAVHDLPGPFYVHCHHGLHRGPTAAVVAAEAVAGWTPQQAVAALQQIGTSPQYKGLYAAARDFQPPTAGELAHADASFPSTAKLNDLSDTMVQVDHRWDNLKAAQKVAWTTPASNPDADPVHEALLLKELLREAHRPGGAAQGRPDDLLQRLSAAEESAALLEATLRANDRAGADKAAQTVQNACSACHTRYRDNTHHR